jgi:hypothetical protein
MLGASVSETTMTKPDAKGKPGRLSMHAADAQRDRSFRASYDGPYVRAAARAAACAAARALGLSLSSSCWLIRA